MDEQIKVITLAQSAIIKNYIDAKDSKAIKSVGYANNKLSFYTTADGTGDVAAEVDLPEELYLDQTKTTFVTTFAWSASTYPGSTDPELDGKSVLVLAVKGTKTVTYSFLAIESVITPYVGETTDTITTTVEDGKIKGEIKVSATDGNLITTKADGLFVDPADVKTNIIFATDEEVNALFTD